MPAVIVIQLTPGAIISGRVYDQAGRPLEGTVIRAFRCSYQATGKSSLWGAGFAVTNDLGEYRLYWLPPGTYYLFATVLPIPRAAAGAPIGSSVINKSEDAPDAFAPTFIPTVMMTLRQLPLRWRPVRSCAEWTFRSRG